MKTKVTDGEIEARFTHHRTNKEGSSTTCVILQNGKTYIGQAYLHPNDNFCKETGRKTSLTRALAKTPLSKEDRAKVWEHYGQWGKNRFTIKNK